MTASTTAAARRPVPAIPDTALVLATRPLRPGVELTGTSQFGDDVWVLTPAVHQRHLRAQILDFRVLPVRFRPVAKELFYRLLTGDLPPDCATISNVATIRNNFSKVRFFLTWVDQQQAATLRALTAADLEGFRRLLVTARTSEAHRLGRLRAARLFWLCRTRLSTDWLSVDPDVIGAANGRAGAGSRAGAENATDRIPEQVHAPLLVWALRWVEEFADDVLGAYGDWALLHAHTQNNRARRGEPVVRGVPQRLAAVLARYRAQRRPLPGHNDAVNLSHLAREVQCSARQLRVPRYWQRIEQAAGDLGIADRSYLPTEIRGRLDDTRWRAPIAYDDIEVLVRLLQTACYIVVAYLSGMRDSEVKHLRRGCLSVWRDDTGRVIRRKVTSQAFKGEQDPAGVTATWIVTAPVQRAVEVLEALQPASQPHLFALPPSSRGHYRDRANQVPTSSTTNRDLVAFTRWVNDYCAERGRPDGIPAVGGRPWRLSTRQFRRTLAWFIARQPGGVIAGAMQYRHLRVQMFEGYAGTSASGFRDEVEAEEAIARGEQLGDLIVNNQQHRLVGPAAEQAEARLAEFERHVQFHGKVINDPKRLKRHMDRHDPHIYPGAFVTCVYVADRALCRRGDGQDGPSLPDCVPLRCRNVALTEANTGAFVAHLASLDRTLAGGDALAPLVRYRLEERRAELARFLAANGVSAAGLKEPR